MTLAPTSSTSLATHQITVHIRMASTMVPQTLTRTILMTCIGIKQVLASIAGMCIGALALIRGSQFSRRYRVSCEGWRACRGRVVVACSMG